MASRRLSIFLDGAAVVDAVFSIPLVANLPVEEPEIERPGRPADEPRGRAERRRVGTGSETPAKPSTKNSQPAGALSSDFLAGPENGLIGVAVSALLDELTPRYNPLVICGPSGTGKTHLARGLAAKRLLACQAGDGRVVFVSGADFARLLHDAITADATASFRERFRGASLVILDDLTQLATKRVAQQEVIHTLDAVIDAGGQVVVTSRAMPSRIVGLSTALASRLAGGLTVTLSPPSAAARLALIERFASLRRIALPHPAARTLADGLDATAPELSGALAELQMRAQLDGAAIDTNRVRRFLADRRSRLRPKLKTIASLAAKHFGLRIGDLRGSSRRRAVVEARGAAIHLARQLTGKSLEEIGRYFGGRDHTTVLHSLETTEARLRNDPAIRRATADIRRLVAQA
jgi:chromosomal replication initiator protein